jgi:pimeloyl-ACP methyl ester carboxylesterase
MKPTRWIATAAIATAVALTTPLAAFAAAPPATDPLAAYDHQAIAWHSCQLGPDDSEGQQLDQAGAHCADVRVPLDYTHPHGRTITIAISRLAATDTAHKIGPLIINTGGPALPNLHTVALAGPAMGATGARFDLIGMDQRFSGRSTPVDCDWPVGWLTRSAGADRASFETMVSLAHDLATRCSTHANLLAYASTANAARDMDVIRAALGAPKLSYLGYSYGSYLGALYTQLFPTHAGRIVLDSAIDPAHVGIDKGNVAPVRQASLVDWAGWAAQHDDQFHLGTTSAAVLATVDRVYRASARHPLHVGAFRVDDTIVPDLLLDPLTDDGDDSSAQLASRVQVLATAAAEGSAQPTDDLTDALTGLLTGANSATETAQVATMCGDAAEPHDPAVYLHRVKNDRSAAPIFGPIDGNISPCAFWPTTPAAPITVHNGVPALIVHADGDINAISALNDAMHAALTGSRMITLQGVGAHGVYLFESSACVDDAVNNYLDTGGLPATDTTC